MRYSAFAAGARVALVLAVGCGGGAPGPAWPDGTTPHDTSVAEATGADPEAGDTAVALDDAIAFDGWKSPEDVTWDSEPAVADEGTPIVICEPGAVENRFGVRVRCSEDGWAWVDDPCPGGTVFDGDGCVANQTIVVVVADAYLDADTQPLWYYQVPTDLFCQVAKWAKQAEAPWWFVTDEQVANVCDPVVSFYQNAQPQLLPYFTSYYIRRILESLRDVPNLRLVLLHPPMRTRPPDVDEPVYDEKALSAFGYYQPVVGEAGEPCGEETYDECMMFGLGQQRGSLGSMCQEPWPEPWNMLGAVLPFTVVGWPDPLNVGVDDLLQWVDLHEEVVDTGKPCLVDPDCGTGTCHDGACWEHLNPEIRALKKDKETYLSGNESTPMLFLAVHLLRMMETEGFPCLSGEDCRPFGECIEHRCHDPGFACRRRHIISITHGHLPPLDRVWIPEVLEARWLRTGLACDTSDDCAGGVECGPIQGKEYCVSLGLGVPPFVCAALPNPFPDVPMAFAIEEALAGLMEAVPYRPAPTARDVGPPIRGTVSVVLSPPVATPFRPGTPHSHWAQAIAVSIGGGGHVVLPEPPGGPTWVKAVFGGFAEEGWEKQLNDLIDDIRKDAATHECTSQDLQGFPEEWLDTGH